MALDDVVWPVVTAIASIAATTVGVTNYLNSRFSSTALKVSQLQGQLDALREQIDDVVMYRINANTELVKHRTERFQAEAKHIQMSLKELSDRFEVLLEAHTIKSEQRFSDLDNRVRDLENYQGKSGFRLRGRQ